MRVCGHSQEDIQDRATHAVNGSVDLDVAIKERLNQYLADTRAQRSLVIRAFMAASRRLDQEGKVSLNQNRSKFLRLILLCRPRWTVTDFPAYRSAHEKKKLAALYVYIVWAGVWKRFLGKQMEAPLVRPLFHQGSQHRLAHDSGTFAGKYREPALNPKPKP